MQRIVRRMAGELVERNGGVGDLVLVGILTRGLPLAKGLAAEIQRLEGVTVPVGSLDITLYRDDLSTIAPNPVVKESRLPSAPEGHTIVLCDDVLYTGRTVRAALDALIEFGRPKAIQLIVLVDRGHRELPIKADYVGKNVPTSPAQSVQVHLTEVDGRDEVEIQEP